MIGTGALRTFEPLSNQRSINRGIGECDTANTVLASSENVEPFRILQLMRERGHVTLRVVGGSMGPWLHPGDIITVRHAEPRTIARGNVIVFLRGGFLITHRVISRLRAGADGQVRWKTKGDSALQTDPPVLEEELLGRVSSIERAGRSLPLDTPLQTAIGWLLAGISPLSRFWYPGARVVKQLKNIFTH
jgi:signal peptidase I